MIINHSIFIFVTIILVMSSKQSHVADGSPRSQQIPPRVPIYTGAAGDMISLPATEYDNLGLTMMSPV